MKYLRRLTFSKTAAEKRHFEEPFQLLHKMQEATAFVGVRSGCGTAPGTGDAAA